MFESAKLVSWTFRQKPYNVLRTPESPLSRHSSIGFHPVKANRLDNLIDREASHRPNQPNCLLQSNTSDLIKESNLTRLSHNLCKVLPENVLILYTETPDALTQKKLTLPDTSIHRKYDTTKTYFFYQTITAKYRR